MYYPPVPPLPLPECQQHTTQADSVDVIDAEFFELVNQGMAEEDLRKELAKLGIGTDGERATLA